MSRGGPERVFLDTQLSEQNTETGAQRRHRSCPSVNSGRKGGREDRGKKRDDGKRRGNEANRKEERVYSRDTSTEFTPLWAFQRSSVTGTSDWSSSAAAQSDLFLDTDESKCPMSNNLMLQYKWQSEFTVSRNLSFTNFAQLTIDNRQRLWLQWSRLVRLTEQQNQHLASVRYLVPFVTSQRAPNQTLTWTQPQPLVSNPKKTQQNTRMFFFISGTKKKKKKSFDQPENHQDDRPIIAQTLAWAAERKISTCLKI